MKKLLYLLFVLTVLSACGSDDPDPTPTPPPITEWDGDWNDSKDPHYTQYKGQYNPIAGEWIVVKKNGVTFNEFMVYKFDTNRTLSTATVKPAEGKAPIFGTANSYIINDKAYKIKNTIYKYKLASDMKTLEITDGTVTLVLQPYESGVWRWKGDWNDPNDPHYAIYNGKYNPIKGTWKLTHVGDNEVLPSNVKYHRFNEDFTTEVAYHPAFPNEGHYDKRKYWINDTGVREDRYATQPMVTYEYKIEGNILYYTTRQPVSVSTWLKFVRYK